MGGSSRPIVFCVRFMQPADNLVASSTEAERKRIIGDLACKHGLSKDRAQMLVDKFGTGRAGLEGAAQSLIERRRA